MLVPLWRSLRPTQWPKNLFVLAPLVFAGALVDRERATAAFGAFIAFCALSSAVYLLNDVLDRERDRRHPLKRRRPIAAGELSVPVALAAASLLGVTALALVAWIDVAVLAYAGAFLLLNLLYSTAIKHVVILDVMTVGVGYVLRVLAGGAAARAEVSDWLLLCTIFLALFLVVSKRRHEIASSPETGAEQRQVLRSYSVQFLDQMINVVTASTLLAYALYTTAAETEEKFGAGTLVFTIPFALFGIFRYLYLTYQVESEQNPTETMLRDGPLLLDLALWGLVVLYIVYGR